LRLSGPSGAGETDASLARFPQENIMADTTRENLAEAGNQVADAAKKAATWVEDKTGLGCGSEKNKADIQPHMSVVSSCGCTMGKADHVDGGAIKLTKNDSPDGQHHFVPVAWVDHVDNHVHLNKNSEETKQGWKSDAGSCRACGA
jgi:hypothetical protein